MTVFRNEIRLSKNASYLLQRVLLKKHHGGMTYVNTVFESKMHKMVYVSPTGTALEVYKLCYIFGRNTVKFCKENDFFFQLKYIEASYFLCSDFFPDLNN